MEQKMTLTICLNLMTNYVWLQSDDTDVTTANEDEVLHQQPNNTRAAAAALKQNPREISHSSKAR